MEIVGISVELGREISGILWGGYDGERKERVEGLLRRMMPYRSVFETVLRDYSEKIRGVRACNFQIPNQ